MSVDEQEEPVATPLQTAPTSTGEAEVVEDVRTVERSPAWLRLKQPATALQALQVKDGSVPHPADHPAAREHVATIVASVAALAPLFPHDAAYLATLPRDFGRWVDGGFGVPDFLDSLVAFSP